LCRQGNVRICEEADAGDGCDFYMEPRKGGVVNVCESGATTFVEDVIDSLFLRDRPVV
jgi:hypothetical protein